MRFFCVQLRCFPLKIAPTVESAVKILRRFVSSHGFTPEDY